MDDDEPYEAKRETLKHTSEQGITRGKEPCMALEKAIKSHFLMLQIQTLAAGGTFCYYYSVPVRTYVEPKADKKIISLNIKIFFIARLSI